jgi:hypothetical protein
MLFFYVTPYHHWACNSAKCDGCGNNFSINHALKCQYGGLIILRHDKVMKELIELGTMALRPAAVQDKPSLITVGV